MRDAFPSSGPHRTIKQAVNVEMKLGIAITVLVSYGLVAAQALPGQAPPAQPQQTKPSDAQKAPATAPKSAPASNQFPEDTTNVPVMPGGNAPVAPNVPSDTAAASTLPNADVDPVRSPDDADSDSGTSAEGFSSSSSGLDRIVPPPDTDSEGGKKGRGAPPEHQETAVEDEKVGDYYLNEHNWKAALSRFESAVVLDPENPEVYWGLGEAHRHLGKFADARANYEKLIAYDPDSKHGKEAKKILKDPEMANAPTAAASKP